MASHRFLPARARDPLARNHRYYLHHTRILTITGLLRRYFLATEDDFVDIHRRYAEREEKEARLLQPRTELSLSC